MYTLTEIERSVIIDALLYSKPEDVFASELRRDALDILQYEGTPPEESDYGE